MAITRVTRDVTISFRVSEKEAELLNRAADSRSLNTSAWIRSAAIGASKEANK
ncbi:predicted protein [Cyanophage PSS2]|uniref:hypothetical protein n=1 Tax=Cyanophage PSS2 TaxID=658401 RepID=UPI0001B04041|nr:hypothetical protein PSS2_gp106 [Cyanophage PSS2]ACT65668.1 hypothetical protein [Cyanophage PSS2]ACY75808.1 predicted protein [Cyanophage PSS2]